MSSAKPYEVRLSRASARAYERLSAKRKDAVRSALQRLASQVGSPSQRGGKRVKTIRGPADSFRRLRVGDLRVMFEVIPEERVLLVLGIVHRSDLERWIRGR